MTIYLNDHLLPYIKKIQEWFREAYGFYPSRKQVILFSIESVEVVLAELTIRYRRQYQGIGEYRITIPDEFGDILNSYIRETGEIFLNPSFLVETLLVFRALSLPPVKHKPLEIKEMKAEKKKRSPTVADYHEYIKELAGTG